MGVPEFIVELRDKVGAHPLWLSGATAVIFDDAGRVLLARRADSGEWAPISGIVEPAEEPARTAIRETREEAGVDVEPMRLASVAVGLPISYDNGDRAQYLDLTFRCRYLGGEPCPVDGEAIEVAWFAADALPTMSEDHRLRVQWASSPTGETIFRY